MNPDMVLRIAEPAEQLSDRQLQDLMYRPDQLDPATKATVRCWSADADADDWSPPVADSKIEDWYAAAQCEGCQLRAICLEYSLRFPQEGIWGGVAPLARNHAVRLRREHERVAAAARPTVDQSLIEGLADLNRALDNALSDAGEPPRQVAS